MSRNDNYHYHHHYQRGGRDHRDKRSYHHQYHHRSSSSHHEPRSDHFDNQPFQVPPFQPVHPPPYVQNMHMFHEQQQYRQCFPHSMMMNQQFLPNPNRLSSNNLPQGGYHPMQSAMTSPFMPHDHGNWGQPVMTDISLSGEPSSSGGTLSNEHAMSALDRLQLPQDKITETGIIPDKPYYELPAGLMVTLVPANQKEYKMLNPHDLRLPFPKFPDENFLDMIDLFYKADGKTRDNDGWDREFIDTYLKQKEALAEIRWSGG